MSAGRCVRWWPVGRAPFLPSTSPACCPPSVNTLCLDGKEKVRSQGTGANPQLARADSRPHPTRNHNKKRRRLGFSASSASARRKAPLHRYGIKGRHRQFAEDSIVTLSPRCEVPVYSPLDTALRILFALATATIVPPRPAPVNCGNYVFFTPQPEIGWPPPTWFSRSPPVSSPPVASTTWSPQRSVATSRHHLFLKSGPAPVILHASWLRHRRGGGRVVCRFGIGFGSGRGGGGGR